MKPVIRYQGQSLFRRSYKPQRPVRFKPRKLGMIFKSFRFGRR
jgi:hypothetical protein